MDCCADSIFPTSERKIPLCKSKGCVLQNSFCDALNIPCYLPKCKYFLPVKGIILSRKIRDISLIAVRHFMSVGTLFKIDMNTP